jgi:hypothetical protein
MDVDPPPSLLARLTSAGEGPSTSGAEERTNETLFRRMGVGLAERLELRENVEEAPKSKKRRGRPPKAIRERLDAERREHGGAL